MIGEQRHRLPKLIVRVRFPSPAPPKDQFGAHRSAISDLVAGTWGVPMPFDLSVSGIAVASALRADRARYGLSAGSLGELII